MRPKYGQKSFIFFEKKEKKSVMCHMSRVICHLITTLCSFSCYESPMRFGDAAAGCLMIDRVKKNYLLAKKHVVRQFLLRQD